MHARQRQDVERLRVLPQATERTSSGTADAWPAAAGTCVLRAPASPKAQDAQQREQPP